MKGIKVRSNFKDLWKRRCVDVDWPKSWLVTQTHTYKPTHQVSLRCNVNSSGFGQESPDYIIYQFLMVKLILVVTEQTLFLRLCC